MPDWFLVYTVNLKTNYHDEKLTSKEDDALNAIEFQNLNSNKRIKNQTRHPKNKNLPKVNSNYILIFYALVENRLQVIAIFLNFIS